jgi:hypothetical protein
VVVVVVEEAEVDVHQVVVEVALLDAMEVLVVADHHHMIAQEVLVVIDMALLVVYLLQMVEAIT